MKNVNLIEAFAAGYITALELTTPNWRDWAVPQSINCCSIDLIHETPEKVTVIAYHSSGRREEFAMVLQDNMYGDAEWVNQADIS